MGDEASEEHQRSLAAPFIFFVVLAFQFASHWIDHFKKVISLFHLFVFQYSNNLNMIQIMPLIIDWMTGLSPEIYFIWLTLLNWNFGYWIFMLISLNGKDMWHPFHIYNRELENSLLICSWYF